MVKLSGQIFIFCLFYDGILFICYLFTSTIILTKYSTFIEGQARPMISWNHATLKMAKEAVRAGNSATETADLDSDVCEGEVRLQITPFESFSQVNKYKKYLATIKDIKVVTQSWSEEEGFSIVVSVSVPLALGRLLQDMPEVARVQLNNTRHGHYSQKQSCKKMTVVLKTPEQAPEPVPA